MTGLIVITASIINMLEHATYVRMFYNIANLLHYITVTVLGFKAYYPFTLM